jgi:cation transport ATPase
MVFKMQANQKCKTSLIELLVVDLHCIVGLLLCLLVGNGKGFVFCFGKVTVMVISCPHALGLTRLLLVVYINSSFSSETDC